MSPFPSPADPAGVSEALAGAPPQLVARLAGRAPDAGQPSRAVLTAALLRIQAQAPARRRARRFSVPAWSGWAAAAGLAVIFTWEHADKFGDGSHNGSGVFGWSAAAIDPHAGQNSSSGRTGAPPAHGGGIPDFSPGADSWKIRAAAAANAGKHRLQTLTAVQNMAQLRRDLARLRASNEARFQPSPGLSRTVVVEMTDPSDPREAARLGALKLSDRVAESIAAGVASDSGDVAAAASGEAGTASLPASNETSDGSPPSPQTPEKKPSEQDLVLSGGDGSWSGDIVIEKGLPNTGLFNLPEGTQIRHLDFPVENASSYRGLQDLGSGWFYDQFSDLLWQPTGQGKAYIGQKAPTGFDRETFTPPAATTPQLVENPAIPTEHPAVPEIPKTTPPADIPAAGMEGTSSSGALRTEIAASTPPVRGYPIFDETTGSGSIILQNLPGLTGPDIITGSFTSSRTDSFSNPPGGGQTYQLWVTDTASDQPISVGLIPPLDGGNGRVWFDLGSPGVAPSGYILTVEPATGSTVPSGRVVLQGP
ncbi:MAG: anti-sigma factor [Verrucomicrobiota bacterium]